MTLPNRNNIIVRMHKRGSTTQQIADHLGCGKSYVVTRLREFGLTKQIKYQSQTDESFWDLPEDKLRMAIARRAAQGARAILASQTKTEHSPLSTQFTD